MIIAPPHPEEEKRLKELHALNILDTEREQSYDDLVALASTICDTPIALISLIDRDRQWFKSRIGLDAQETGRDVSFCSHAILDNDILVVPDPRQDARFAHNPLVHQDPNIGFYAGVPLYSEEVPMGTLCVLDHEPRQLSEAQQVALKSLARQAEKLFALRKQVAALQEAQRQQDKFISMLNHELRTPLTSILGTLSLLNANKVGTLPTQASAMVDIAQRNGHRLLGIINDLLDTSALGAGKFKQCPETFDLRTCVEQAIQEIEAEAQKKHRQLKLNAPVAPANVVADPHRIGQVLQNLLSNAIKYSSEDSTIDIDIEAMEGHHKVTVSNQGPGIPTEKQSQLFQKYFRSQDDCKDSPPGTGLGLYISKQIIHLSQGQIGCHSEPHQTTSFWFTLPCPATP